jgi:hypothetical protein
MKGLELVLNTDMPGTREPTIPQNDDILGALLTDKWTQWSTTRRHIEEHWLEDLRAYNQQNDNDEDQISKFHKHIYIGQTRTKCNSAYSRLSDLMFQANDAHWSIAPTPIPKDKANDPNNAPFLEAMKAKAEAMTTEISDQMLDLHYEDHLKAAMLEACIIGTGCVKGVIPGVKKLEKWAAIDNPETGVQEWDIEKSEIPAPVISSPSIFDVYPDPFATVVEDMSGVFERHILNRQQLSAFRDDARFDSDKIKEILARTDTGDHVATWHETARRTIAKVTNTTGDQAGRYDVLEYWGQATGRQLQSAGVEDVEDDQTYWANVWTCMGKTLLAKLMPMKKQRIPYNFFIYNKIPHQFWGVSPARMGRSSQLGVNGVVRSLLDGMSFAAVPMAEVNIHMLKDGQDPSILRAGQIFLRDSGDPSTPAVRFFQPDIPVSQLMQMGEMFKEYGDLETSLPAYSYGQNTSEINETSSGLAMQMNAASLPIKMVAKNLEDGLIHPLIESWYNWNMEWSENDAIKGDMEINVLGTSALLAKEHHGQQLMQFLTLAANPLDMQMVDRKYLLTQIAKNLEIDVEKALPDEMPENPQQQGQQESALDLARAKLLAVQAEKTAAETTDIKVKSQFSAVQTAGQVVMNTSILPVSDSLLESAGYVDANGPPLAENPIEPIPQQQPDMQMPVNTHPNMPANVQSPQEEAIEEPVMPGAMASPAINLNQGIETARMD